MRLSAVLVCLVVGSGFGLDPTPVVAQGDQPLPASHWQPTADRIVEAALAEDLAWTRLTYLSDVIGHRLSGSVGLERAISWAATEMRADGFETVRLQDVMVPHWVRGAESLELLAPQVRSIPLLGLGGSVSTPPGGIEAEAVVVRSFEEFDALPDEAIAGKIVVWAVEWKGYGGTVAYRGTGASRAAARGAVASLVRSATGLAARLPHTGALRYDDTVPRIPGAAIAPEDSEWMRRIAARGETIRLRLVMNAQTLPDAKSANVLVDIPGRELPDEVVVMGGHWDSWDVGQGAHDDGGPSIAAWHALTLLKKLGLQPRRTLRVVLWTNEENGLRGGRDYRAALGDQVGQHVAAIEMDGGLEKPVGFGFGLTGADSTGADPRYERAYARLQEIAALLGPVGATTVKRGGGGADIGPLMRDGVPGLSLDTVGEHYFDWHHTEADTLDKIDPQHLREAVAAFAVMGFVLADMPDRLVEPTPALQPAAATPASP